MTTEKRRHPTPEQRDERIKIEGDFEDAVKRLLHAPEADPGDDDEPHEA